MVKQSLLSFHIIERESNGENLLIWTFPTIANETAVYVKTRCFPSQSEKKELFFFLRKNKWIYIKKIIGTARLTALVLIADELQPTKYKLLCDILSRQYVKTKDPVELTKLYINLISAGTAVYQENGSELSLNLKTFTSELGLKEIIANFGLEVILIYNAILLKRRILVYHYDIEKLQTKIVAMTYLVPNRNPKEYLLPWVENTNELRGASFYLAGVTEKSVIKDERYCDLQIDLLENEIVISKAAKDCFQMAKIHKDIAQFLVQLSESDLNEVKVIDEIKRKTNEILQQLYSIAKVRDNKKMITINDLKSQKYNPALENFLFNLAVAENIIVL